MNRIITTSISDPTIQQPFTGKSLDFLQNASKEAVLAAVLGQIGESYNSSLAYVLKGLVSYGTGNYTEGYILYSGEIYYSAGKSDSIAFVNIPVMTVTVTNDSTADPVIFTDGVSRNVHNNRKIVLSDALTGTGTFDLGTAIYLNKWVTASTPTYSALTTADVLVVGGVTVASESYQYVRTNKGLRLIYRTTDISTTATTAKVGITLPIAIPTVSGNITLASGVGACRFYKSGTGGVPCYVWTSQNSSGAGTGLQIEKLDGTAFGVLNNYECQFEIDIAFNL